jgi:hypothetical protein
VEASRWKIQPLAIISLIAGCLLGARTGWHLILVATYSIRGYSVDLWYVLIKALLFGLAVYLISVGLRRMRHTEEEWTKRPRIGWGKLLVGAFLIVSCLSNLLHPLANSFDKFKFEPSNERQERAMKATELLLNVFMPVVGVGLMISGIRARFKMPGADDATSNPHVR